MMHQLVAREKLILPKLDAFQKESKLLFSYSDIFSMKLGSFEFFTPTPPLTFCLIFSMKNIFVEMFYDFHSHFYDNCIEKL